jgi:hypothetical protein
MLAPMRHVGGCGLLLAAVIAQAALASEPAPLPTPELTEPFAIGEALLDPARVDQAVVSLVARMGIELNDNLIRGLIEMSRDDLANAKDGRLPWSFRDLHKAIHPLLPELTVEHMAGQYNSAYSAAPESLAAQVMQGQPLEPDTPLTRAQIWFLIVDGFAPPVVAPKLAQLAPIAQQSSSGPSYGTASLTFGQLPSPILGLSNQDYYHLLSILPMLAYQLPFDVVPFTTQAHEGHGGPGRQVAIEARIGVGPNPPIGPSGAVLLRPLVADRSNRMIWWEVRDRSAMERHGSFDVIDGVPVRTDFMGVARLRYTPKKENANGQGTNFAKTASVGARISQWDLLTSQYDMPPVLAGFALGDRNAPGVMVVAWHEKGMRIRIENNYVAKMDLGFLGNGFRRGKDLAEGSLEEQPNGSWEGTVTATIHMTQFIQGLGQSCPETTFDGTQELKVTGEVWGALGGAQTIVYDQAASTAEPDGGYLALTFETAGPASVTPTQPCLDLIERDYGQPPFLPLNDARWTQLEGRYVIVLPTKGLLVYEDFTADSDATGPDVRAAVQGGFDVEDRGRKALTEWLVPKRRYPMEARQRPRILLAVLFALLPVLQAEARHPLDALDAAEITATMAILKSAGHVDDKTLVSSISLQEPPKTDVLAWKASDAIPRSAKAVLRRNATTFEAVVDLGSGDVLSHKAIPGAQPFVTLPEILTAIEVTTSDPKMRVGLRKRGITDFQQLFCAPRTVGNFGAEIERTRRIVKVDCFDIRGVKSDVFANPIEGLFATVDLDRGEVLEVTDLGVVPIPRGNSELDPASTGVRGNTRPIVQSAPEGSNITVDGSMVRWQNWSFHLRWDLREGVVVSLVNYQDGDRSRSVLYQGHLSEIFVPYQDPTGAGITGTTWTKATTDSERWHRPSFRARIARLPPFISRQSCPMSPAVPTCWTSASAFSRSRPANRPGAITISSPGRSRAGPRSSSSSATSRPSGTTTTCWTGRLTRRETSPIGPARAESMR